MWCGWPFRHGKVDLSPINCWDEWREFLLTFSSYISRRSNRFLDYQMSIFFFFFLRCPSDQGERERSWRKQRISRALRKIDRLSPAAAAQKEVSQSCLLLHGNRSRRASEGREREDEKRERSVLCVERMTIIHPEAHQQCLHVLSRSRIEGDRDSGFDFCLLYTDVKQIMRRDLRLRELRMKNFHLIDRRSSPRIIDNDIVVLLLRLPLQSLSISISINRLDNFLRLVSLDRIASEIVNWYVQSSCHCRSMSLVFNIPSFPFHWREWERESKREKDIVPRSFRDYCSSSVVARLALLYFENHHHHHHQLFLAKDTQHACTSNKYWLKTIFLFPLPLSLFSQHCCQCRQWGYLYA